MVDGANLYEYVGDNPTGYIDHTGGFKIDWKAVGKGALVAAAGVVVGAVVVTAVVATGGAAAVAIAGALGASASTAAAVGTVVTTTALVGVSAYGGYQTGKTITEVATGKDYHTGKALSDTERSEKLGESIVAVGTLAVGAKKGFSGRGSGARPPRVSTKPAPKALPAAAPPPEALPAGPTPKGLLPAPEQPKGLLTAGQQPKGLLTAGQQPKGLLPPKGGTTGAAGSIKYGELDALGRPTGVSARITAEMIGTGSPASPRIQPPGFITGRAGANRARGHLLGDQLGGSGTEARNLVTMEQTSANTPTMRGIETQVRNAVEAGEVVDYSATPVYNFTGRIPMGITIQARGTGGLSIDVTVLNPPGMGRGW